MVMNKAETVKQSRLNAIKRRLIRLTEVGVNLVASTEEGVGISTRSFADGMGVHIELARELLRDFEKSGFITRTGVARGTRWHLG